MNGRSSTNPHSAATCSAVCARAPKSVWEFTHLSLRVGCVGRETLRARRQRQYAHHMRLHHQPRSRSTRVLWALEEIGAPFELTVITSEDKKSPEYRALHPLGRSPVLEEDGGPVFESAGLILHVADLHPEAGLIAAPGSHERALQYQWCFFGMTDLEAALVDVARQLWKESGEPDTDVIDRARVRFAAAAAVIEAAVSESEFLVANTFSVADIVIGSVLGFARTAELAELLPGVVPYVDRLEARPARQRAVAVSV